MKKYLFILKVKSSKIDGKGLFADTLIPRRKKIGELTGEIISVSKARKIAKLKQKITIVELNDNNAMDASSSRNNLKYINHSCLPNTYMRIINNRVEFYSLRNICKFEELTCNYGETHHEGTLKCNCKSEPCKGYL